MPSTVILSYPKAMKSSVLGLSDMLSHAALAPVTVSAKGEAPSRARAVILPPSAGESHPREAPWIVDWLSDQAGQGALICSACTGSRRRV
ncbi:hypothetical protein ACFORG_03070 [Lutimaribacter marinistellae]|uniref:DJ-1/PfpI family protein n=1 Tax=Lutimaribacter marinistellae TaxID=1820329 RepID=A0ABV7TC41_9RHOB